MAKLAANLYVLSDLVNVSALHAARSAATLVLLDHLLAACLRLQPATSLFLQLPWLWTLRAAGQHETNRSVHLPTSLLTYDDPSCCFAACTASLMD